MTRAQVDYLQYRRRAFGNELGRGLKAMNDWRVKFLRAFRPVRRWAYRTVFTEYGPHAIVLRDMAVFCRLFETCVIPGDRDRSLILEGRREYALRVMEHLNLSIDQLYRLYGGVVPPVARRDEEE